MAEFAYKGRSDDGQLHTGKLVASSRDAVAGRLVSLGITPIEISDVREQKEITLADISRKFGGGRPTSKDMILFCRQMYTITKAGLPLLRGLNGLIATTHNEVLKEALVEVLAKLEAGRLALDLQEADIFGGQTGSQEGVRVVCKRSAA